MKALLTIIVALALTAPALANTDPYITVKGIAVYTDGTPYARQALWFCNYPDANTVGSRRVITNKRGHFRIKLYNSGYKQHISTDLCASDVLVIDATENTRNVVVVVPLKDIDPICLACIPPGQ